MKNLRLTFWAILVTGCLLPVRIFSQDFAIKVLEESPRHHEWVEVQSGGKAVHCFVAYPEKSGNTPAVIVIHENRGLTDWVRSVADKLAEAGYLAIAPDLLSEFDSLHHKTTDFANQDAARNALYLLKPEKVSQDLDAVFEYIRKAPSSNGKVAVMGFCWGGSQTFRFATNNKKVHSALVFYGTAPQVAESFSAVTAPVFGFYGGEDQRVNASIETTEKEMKARNKTYEYVIYPGAGHAFMRSGDDPAASGPNKTARDAAWLRVLEILGGM